MSGRAGAALVLVWVLVSCGGTPAERGSRYLQRGKARLAEKDYARAILDLRSAARLLNRNPEPYYQLALAYESSGDRGEAVQFLEKSTAVDSNYLAAQVRLAELMAASANRESLLDVVARTQKVLRISPGNADALHALALAEMRLGKSEAAVSHLEEALQKMPQHLKSSVTLAQIKMSARDFSGAETVLHDAAKQAPSSIEAAVALGRMYVFLHKSEEGEQQFRHALALDPKYGPALMDLAAQRALRGDQLEAEALYKRASTLSQSEYEGAYTRYLLESGKPDAAIAEAERLWHADPTDRQARSQLVRAYFVTHRMAAAERLLNRALEQNPKDAEALEQRGQFYLWAGRIREARRDLRLALADRSDSASERYYLAKADQAAGAIFSYQQELGETLRLDSSQLTARIELSQALRALNGARSAVALMDDAPRAQRDSLPAVIERNWALLDLKQQVEARKGIEKGLALSRAPELLVQLGTLRLQQGLFTEARTAATEALEKDPDNVKGVELLASSYTAAGQGSAALQKVRDYAAGRPKSLHLQLLLGEWLEASGQHQEARIALLAAKAVEPASTTADLALVELDMRHGNEAAARPTLSRLVRESDNAIANLLLGYLDDSSGHAEEAVAHYQRVVESDPSNVVALNNLAFALANHSNQIDDAIRYAERAGQIAPVSAAVQDTIGWAYFRKGIYRTSASYLEKANTLEPSAGRMYHLAMAYAKSGRPDEARKTYQAALKMNSLAPEAQMAKQLLNQPTDIRK
jgi:tetratricopeptide (TPR) repeat protein